MRILVLGAGGAFRTEAALARGLATLGHEARVLDALGWRRRLGRFAPRLLRWQADGFAPDLVLATRHAASAGDALPHLVRGRRSAFWMFDAPAALPEAVVRVARGVDRVFATCTTQCDSLRAAGVAAPLFLPQGMDPATDRPALAAPAAYRCEVSFVGSGQFVRRHAVLRTVAAAARLQIRGPQWEQAPPDLPVAGGPVRGGEFGRVVHAADISLGADALAVPPGERGGCTSNRLWRVLGCGGFFLGEMVTGIERLIAPGVHAAWYRTPAEAAELVRHYLGDAAARARIREAGRAHALAHHTYADRLALLLAGQGYTST